MSIRPFQCLVAPSRLICVLMAFMALFSQVATASKAVDRTALALAIQQDGAAPVMCGHGHRIAAIEPVPPVRSALPPPVWVMPSGSDAADLLAPDQPALRGPDHGYIRLAGARQGLRGPPDADDARPYPRGPPLHAT